MTPPVADRSRHYLHWFWPPPAIARRLWPTVAAATGYTALVCTAYQWFQPGKPGWGEGLGLVNALVVGVLVGFRTKAAYDRWWEGRCLWGDLTNQSRNLCLKAAAIADPDPADRQELARLVGAFAAALARHLRGPTSLRQVPGFEQSAHTPAHVPAYLAGRAIALVARWRAADRIDGHGHQILDAHTSALMNVCGACERVKTTPLPGSYLALLRHGLLLGFILFPLHLAVSLGWWSVPVQAVLVYFLFGIELTAEEVEQPFGFDPDDLPLEQFSAAIARNAAEILGVESALPGGRVSE